MSTPQMTVFVDVGYIRSLIATATDTNTSRARVTPSVIRSLTVHATGQDADRIYWYDGVWPSTHARHAKQQKYLEAVGAATGVHLRLGDIVERPAAWRTKFDRVIDKLGIDGELARAEVPNELETVQKGVDVRLALDLYKHAVRDQFGQSLLIAGDGDLTPALVDAADEGHRVTVAGDLSRFPRGLTIAADEVFNLSRELLRAVTGFDPDPVPPAAAPFPDALRPVVTAMTDLTEMAEAS